MKVYEVVSDLVFRHIHLVAADSPEEAISIAEKADDNLQEYVEYKPISVEVLTESRYNELLENPEFYNGVCCKNYSVTMKYVSTETFEDLSNLEVLNNA